MDGKYLIGSQGSEYLHQQLSNNEPAVVISNFQERYGLVLEGVDVNVEYLEDPLYFNCFVTLLLITASCL